MTNYWLLSFGERLLAKYSDVCELCFGLGELVIQEVCFKRTMTCPDCNGTGQHGESWLVK